MASISPYKTGFRAQIFLLGVRDSGTFRTKREASAWASARETEIRNQKNLPIGEQHTLGEMFDRYLEETVPKHRGHVREAAAVKAISKRFNAALPIARADSSLIAAYRDARLKEVAGATVLRELKVIALAFEEARVEWKWITENPVRDIRKPPSSPHRERTITWSEMRIMLREMKFPRRKNSTALAFLLALRTGMREDEICSLSKSRIKAKSVSLLETKTNPREVPLSKKARRILDQILARSKAKKDSDPILGPKASTLSGLFIRYRDRAGLEGFTFHDTRHTAATWIAKKVDVLTLCKIFGWTDPKMAMVYYNPKAADIADQLD